MKRRRAVVAVAIALLCGAPIVPSHIVSVKNVTGEKVLCRIQSEGKGWEVVVIPPAQEWQRRVTRKTSAVTMTCAAPVRAVLYKLNPGRRYVLLRGGKGGEIELRDVASAQ